MTIGADPTPGPAASDSFEQLVNLHERRAQYVARRLTGNSEDAKDAVQEGFLAAFLARDRFRNDAPFGPWLARIVANEAHERRKHTTRHLRLQRRAEQAFAPASAEAADSMTLRLED